MLYYAALHPQWDCFHNVPEADLPAIGNLLDTISLNHFRKTVPCFDALEQHGIFLGDGGFLVALVQEDPAAPVSPGDTDFPRRLVRAARQSLRTPLWYCYTVGGRLYLLICCPRLSEQDPGLSARLSALREDFSKLTAQLLPDAPALRILVSDIQFGAAGIFRCFNNLHHALEYYDFRTEKEPLRYLDTEQALHGAFAESLSLYRQLSVQIAELLNRETEEHIAAIICDRIIAGSAPTMESIHHHVQLFMLTFTDYLGSSGLVDSSYIQNRRIHYRAFAFETEADFRRTMQTLMAELKRQHRVLRAVGRGQHIQRIREYILEHITTPNLTVAQLSEHFCISTTQLGKQFRHYYGLSPYQFIQRSRLLEAQGLIQKHPDWTMAKIAEAAGYSELSTMYRAFQRHGGMTPGALQATVRAGTAGS